MAQTENPESHYSRQRGLFSEKMDYILIQRIMHYKPNSNILDQTIN